MQNISCDNLDNKGGTRLGSVDFTDESRAKAREALDISNRLKASYEKKKKEWLAEEKKKKKKSK